MHDTVEGIGESGRHAEVVVHFGRLERIAARCFDCLGLSKPLRQISLRTTLRSLILGGAESDDLVDRVHVFHRDWNVASLVARIQLLSLVRFLRLAAIDDF